MVDVTDSTRIQEALRERATALDAVEMAAGEAMLDIGQRSIERFAKEIVGAKTVIWNGPMGVFETKPFDEGTRRVAEAIATATDRGATTIVGGGDSAAAVAAFGLEDRMSHVSTGGGASLEFLEGKTLPGVAVLDETPPRGIDTEEDLRLANDQWTTLMSGRA